MLNKVILIGRLTKDPEYRQTQSGIPFCRFTIAVDRTYKKDAEKQADFISCTAWRNTADFVSKYFTKGKMIVAEGSLQNNNYTDNNGVKHYSMDFLVQNVSFGESKGQSEPQTPHFDTVPVPGQKNDTPLILDDISDFEEVISDGEAPF